MKEARECARGAQGCVLLSACSEHRHKQCGMIITFVILLSWKFICSNRFPSFLRRWVPELGLCLDAQAQDVSCAGVPCPALPFWEVFLFPVALWCQPGHSWGSLGWEQPQPSRSCIDPETSKLPRLSHLQPPFCPSLRKKENWRSCKTCSFPAGLNTDVSVVNLLGSYKNFPVFPDLPGQFLGSESSKWICRRSSSLCCQHRHQEQARAETLIEFGCQNPSLGSL